MQHLSLEELARLVEEEPDAGEAVHLEVCAECRAELSALREQTLALSRLPDRHAPRTGWPRLEARLRAEGLLAAGRSPGWSWGTPLLRVAAALALFVSGGVTGSLLRGGEVGAGRVAAVGVPTEVAAVRTTDAGTAEDAAAAVRSAEAAYLAALTRYAELTQPEQPVDPVNRLAALEGIVLTTRAALEEAPADPVINGYHLTALSQRNAMLRQIQQTGARDVTWF